MNRRPVKRCALLRVGRIVARASVLDQLAKVPVGQHFCSRDPGPEHGRIGSQGHSRGQLSAGDASGRLKFLRRALHTSFSRLSLFCARSRGILAGRAFHHLQAWPAHLRKPSPVQYHLSARTKVLCLREPNQACGPGKLLKTVATVVSCR